MVPLSLKHSDNKKMIKVFLKKILDFFFTIYYFVISFIYILLPNNFLKILRSNTIILMDDGGFGHQFLVPDFGTYTGSFMLTTLEYAGEYNGEVTYSFTFESNGAITFATV